MDIASKFFLEDVPGAKTRASRLGAIIEAVAAERPLSVFQQAFLDDRRYLAFRQLACGELDIDSFRLQAKAEQERRILAQIALKEKEKGKEEDAQRRLAEVSQKKNAAIFAASEIRKRARELRKRFGLGYIEREDFGRVQQILRSVAAGQPIGEHDLVWLGSAGLDYWTDELRMAHHHILARHLTEEWQRIGDPWTAVNACSHWRKAGHPGEALPMTEAMLVTAEQPKLRSALCTTRGGAMRDLRRFEDAVRLGSEAHDLTPRDFRPCTLLGAVHIEMGALAEGAEWYERAEAMGASRNAIDRDLQSILSAAAPKERNRIAAFFKALDADRYSWIGGRKG